MSYNGVPEYFPAYQLQRVTLENWLREHFKDSSVDASSITVSAPDESNHYHFYLPRHLTSEEKGYIEVNLRVQPKNKGEKKKKKKKNK